MTVRSFAPCSHWTSDEKSSILSNPCLDGPMRKWHVLVVVLISTCCTILPSTRTSHHIRVVADTLLLARVTATAPSRATFDSALAWAREHRLETGGCATLVARQGIRFFVADAHVAFEKQWEDSVLIVCRAKEILWHTHYKPEDFWYVGCGPSPQDLANTNGIRLSIVVCGIDSLVPYGWTDSTDGFIPQRVHTPVRNKVEPPESSFPLWPSCTPEQERTRRRRANLPEQSSESLFACVRIQSP